LSEQKPLSSLSRRNFLQTSLIGTAALLPTVAARAPASATADTAPTSFELNELTLDDLQVRMSLGKLSSRSLVEKYLARIDAVDKHGPTVNSVIEINPDALSIADALDRERKEKGTRTPLHGIPVLIKDNIDTADRMMTTAGSLALVSPAPAQDSTVAKKLRDAGAVILGKTNLSEWANIRSSHSTSGWSGRGGLTRNPYALDRNACGSSSGSAASVTANFCGLAVGTETDGSVVCPASVSGIVGIKPTLGLISRAGIIPIAHSQDTAGPMARTVAEAAVLLTVLAGPDPRDPESSASEGRVPRDFTRSLDPSGLRGARLGVARKYMGFNDAVDRLMEDAVAELKRQGATVIDPADLPSHGKFDDTEFTVLLYETKADLNAYLATRPGAPVRSLEEIIAFNEHTKDKEMPYFGQDVFLKAQAKGPLTEKEYLDALQANHRLSRQEGIDAVMDQNHLDALIAPTQGPAWLTDLINGDHAPGGCSNAAAVAGYPHITVPAGFIDGLPVGLSFFGRAWSEPVLLKLAYSFEQASRIRKPPQFLASIRIP
jgi:amidase